MVDYVVDELSHFVCCGYIKSTTQQCIYSLVEESVVVVVKFSLCIVSISYYVDIEACVVT